MTDSPEASVIIPAFDAGSTIGQQLDALSRQRVPCAFEVLVCDNGSADDTVAISESWADRLPIRVVDASARRGPAAARNIGVHAARGGMLLFCDADDVVADDWLGEMVDGLREADFVAGSFDFTLLNRPAIGQRPGDEPTFVLAQAPGLPATSSSNMGIRSAVFAEVGGFDESFRTAEDIDFCWRVQFAGHALTPWPSAIVHYRRRTTLGGAFRQSFSYGAGQRALQRKWGDLSAVRAPESLSTARSPEPPRELPADWMSSQASAEGGARKAVILLRRFRGRGDLIFLAERAGHALGRHLGRRAPVERGVIQP